MKMRWCYFVILFATIVDIVTCIGDIYDYLDYVGSPGTQHNRKKSDPNYYSTNSDVPNLPFIHGYMGSHGTYRFITVMEQTMTVIGEAKHGIWRVQENGFIREYRKKGKSGLKDGTDANEHCSKETLDTIEHSYSNFILEEGFSGYKYPDDKISDGKADGIKGDLNFIDLSIYHPKYKGKYDDHVPIELPHFYCTMSQNDYPYLKNVWKYAVAQPQANKVGPLGKRAGLDIKEHYLNLVRLDFFPDAGMWVNTGVGKRKSNFQIKNREDAKTKYQTVNYERLDLTKYNYEVYLVERPFFNKPYIFVVIVIEDKYGPSQFSFVRRSGAYWKGLVKNGKLRKVPNKKVNQYPKVFVENERHSRHRSRKFRYSKRKPVYSLPLYGVHNPNRPKFGLSGGACPERGGDWGRYPWSSAGSGWPTNYQEVTPLCDAFMIDIKFWKNLWNKSWKDPQLGLGNAGFPGVKIQTYTADSNLYGRYDLDQDFYLRRSHNPFVLDLTLDGKTVEASTDPKPPRSEIKIGFSRYGKALDFNWAGIKKDSQQQCPVQPECNQSTVSPSMMPKN